MSVKLKLCDAYKQAMPDRPEFVEVNGATVRNCIEDLVTRFPDMKKYIYDGPDEICAFIQFFHNGLFIPYDELDKPVKDGDEIFPLMIIGGG
jgi:molybdopterin converting factor small subunit